LAVRLGDRRALGVAAAEALALLIGASASHWLDGAITDADHPDGFAERRWAGCTSARCRCSPSW
jgi:hypothetical protein